MVSRRPARLRALSPQGALPAPGRAIPPGHIVANHTAIQRARRKRLAWGEDDHAIYTRHRWRVEGAHGTAKTLHGLGRAVRRGLGNMKTQALLTAIAMNLKKLAAATVLSTSKLSEPSARR